MAYRCLQVRALVSVNRRTMVAIDAHNVAAVAVLPGLVGGEYVDGEAPQQWVGHVVGHCGKASGSVAAQVWHREASRASRPAGRVIQCAGRRVLRPSGDGYNDPRLSIP